MILSNEPGYYHDGSFGIRLENLVRIVAAKTPNNFQDQGFLTFETITLCPIQVIIELEVFCINIKYN
jgi:Xaa-Pro aminopeptidase